MLEDVRNGKLNGQMVWICDLRYDNYGDKPIRHIRPTKALVRDNKETTKNIYYSESHFVELNKKDEPIKSKVHSVFDSTGFRSRTGTPLQVFNNEADCRKAYTSQVSVAIHGLENHKKSVVKTIDDKIEELKNYV